MESSANCFRNPSHRFAGFTIGFLKREVNNENVYTVPILTPFNELFSYTNTCINARPASFDTGFAGYGKTGLNVSRRRQNAI